MSDEKNTQQDQQGNAAKEAKKFQKNFKRLIALFSGESLFAKPKIDAGGVTAALEKLVKEDREAFEKSFIEGARKLIKRKQEFDAFVKTEQQKMDKAVLDKKKEFNKEMEGLFGIVEKIENIERSYYSTLTDLSTGAVEEEAADTTEDGGQEEE